MGAVCSKRHCGFKSGLNRLEFRFKKSFKIGHDLRVIDHDRPRSSVDRAPDSLELPIDDRGIDSTRKDPRSRLNRAAIAVRSDRDRGVLPRVTYVVGLESDAPDSREETEKPDFTVAVGSRSRGKSIASHPSQRRSDALGSSTCRKVSPLIASLTRSFYARALIGDRVDSGPRDLCRSTRIQRSSHRHASCKTETVWEHSPTWRKYRDILRLNRGAPPPFKHSVTVPQCYQGSTIPVGPPSTYLPATWRPTRAPTWTACSRGLLPRGRAIVRLAWATRTLPRGLSAVSHPEAVLRATSAAAWLATSASRHVITCRLVNPFLRF